MLQELHGLQVLIAAVDVRHPLAVVLAIVQVQHGGHRIHTDSVGVILVRPEQGVGDQEIGNARPAVVVNQRAPVGVRALARVLMLIHAGPVKTSHTVGIPREMGRNPVQNHADPLAVHIVHEIHKIIRSAVTAGGRVIAGHLIAPGGVQRMLHHRHQLHMGVTHLLHVIRQRTRDFPVIVKFRAGDLLAFRVQLQLLAFPGAQMNLVNGHRAGKQLVLRPFLHPIPVLPLIPSDIPDHGGRVRAQLRVIGVRIGLQHGKSRLGLDFILVNLSRLQAGNKQLENAGVPQETHGMAASVPEVKIAHHADPHGAGRPD